MLAYEPLSPQPIPTSAAFKDVGILEPSGHDEDKPSPQKKTPNPLGAKLCPTCDKGCRTTKILNNHVKEVHSGLTFTCRNCTKTYKTKSNRVKHEKNCTPAPCSPARAAGPALLPARELDSPWSDGRPPAYKPEGDPDEEMTISDRDGKDPVASLPARRKSRYRRGRVVGSSTQASSNADR